MPTNIDPEMQKKLIKDAIKEWLNECYADFGRYTVKGVMALAFAGAVYLALRGQGWSIGK
jgi:hypothetical protein